MTCYGLKVIMFAITMLKYKWIFENAFLNRNKKEEHEKGLAPYGFEPTWKTIVIQP